MKLSRGKNWFQIDSRTKSLYVGAFNHDEKEAEGKYGLKMYSFVTRRFKIVFVKDRNTKKWEFQFAGKWSSEGTKNERIEYDITVYR